MAEFLSALSDVRAFAEVALLINLVEERTIFCAGHARNSSATDHLNCVVSKSEFSILSGPSAPSCCLTERSKSAMTFSIM